MSGHPSTPALAPLGAGARVDLSIIIVNWNTQALLAACLQTIAPAARRVTTETIVVDNGSSDGSVAMVQSAFPAVQVIESGANLGFARANNMGIRAANGRYLFLLNSDTLLSPGALDDLVAFADAAPQVGIVGPRLLYADGRDQPSWAAFPTVGSELFGVNLRMRRLIDGVAGWRAFETEWLMGAALLCRRAALEATGLFDESFFMYSEETDLCKRMAEADWKVCVLDDVTIVHLGGGSASIENLRQLQLLYENKIRYFAKHHGAAQACLMRYALASAIAAGIVLREVRYRLGRECGEAARKSISVRRTLFRDLATGRVAESINVAQVAPLASAAASAAADVHGGAPSPAREPESAEVRPPIGHAAGNGGRA
jgi:GT2 family glycosyltransferase